MFQRIMGWTGINCRATKNNCFIRAELRTPRHCGCLLQLSLSDIITRSWCVSLSTRTHTRTVVYGSRCWKWDDRRVLSLCLGADVQLLQEGPGGVWGGPGARRLYRLRSEDETPQLQHHWQTRTHSEESTDRSGGSMRTEIKGRYQNLSSNVSASLRRARKLFLKGSSHASNSNLSVKTADFRLIERGERCGGTERSNEGESKV